MSVDSLSLPLSEAFKDPFLANELKRKEIKADESFENNRFATPKELRAILDSLENYQVRYNIENKEDSDLEENWWQAVISDGTASIIWEKYAVIDILP